MKKINTYLIVLMTGLVAMLVSCNTDNEGAIYNPVLPEVSFSVSKQSKIIPLEEMGVDVNVRVVRGNTSGAYTVSYEAKISDQDVFSDESHGSITFAEGEGTAMIILKGQNLEIGKMYTIALALSDGSEKDMSDRGLASTTVEVMRDYNWVNAGTVLYSEGDFELGDVEVPVQRAEGFNLYRLPDLYYNLTGGKDPDIKAGYALQFTLDDDYNAMTVNPVKTFFSLGTGYDYYYDSEKHPDECTFTNEGDKYSLTYLFTDSKPTLKYAGSATFVWKEGYPKDEK